MPNTQQSPSKSVWVSQRGYDSVQTGTRSLYQIPRLQSVDWALSYPLEDTRYVDGGVDFSSLVPNGIDVTLRWLSTGLNTEVALGLIKGNNTGQPIIDLIKEKNLYVGIENEVGVNSIGASLGSSKTVIGFGQGVLTQYQASAAVGGFLEAGVTVNYLNAIVYDGYNTFYTGISGLGNFSGYSNPAIDYQNGSGLTGFPFFLHQPTAQTSANGINAITANDITLSIYSGKSPFGIWLSGDDSCYLQSFSVNAAIDRREQRALGYVHPLGRPAIYPIKVELTTEAVVSEYQIDQLRNSINTCQEKTSLVVNVNRPCTRVPMYGFNLTDARIESQSFGMKIGDYDTVTTKWVGYSRNSLESFISGSIRPRISGIFSYSGNGSCGGESWGYINAAPITVNDTDETVTYVVGQSALVPPQSSITACGLPLFPILHVFGPGIGGGLFTMGETFTLSRNPADNPYTFRPGVWWSFSQFGSMNGGSGEQQINVGLVEID